jgi:pyruvate,water dikinase
MNTLGNILKAIKKHLGWDGANKIPFPDLFGRFEDIIQQNNAAMELIADMGGKTGGEYLFDKKYLIDKVKQLEELVRLSAYDLNFITNNQYPQIYGTIESLARKLENILAGKVALHKKKPVYDLDEIDEFMEDVAGYKAYNLSIVHNLAKANVPSGFVVAIVGFRNYLAYNNLFKKIEELIEAYREEKMSVESVSHAVRLLILGGDIPPELRREILSAAELICEKSPESWCYSVRSSAVGEGGDFSFAGLHDSFLNVSYSELLSSFKKTMASLYNPASLEYRKKMNLFSMEMAMPVLFQGMVRSRVAGVLYTVDPNEPEKRECILSASWGLGNVVVEDQGQVDVFRVSRVAPHLIIEKKIGSKTWMVAPREIGSARKVPAELQNEPCLTPQEAATIVEASLILERYFKRPLDVEWSLDEGGKLWILQARPINIPRASGLQRSKLKGVLEGHRILLQERGTIAYQSIGAGPVWIVRDSKDLSEFPSGGVLVSRFAPPWLARAIPRASAVVTDIGSPTGHMATVAREFRVPALVDTAIATKILKPGQEVTVDAEERVIYEGRISELLRHKLLRPETFETTHEFRLLRRLLRRIAPLSLTDPEAPNFNAESCQTFHDIMRFMHEKAIQALAQVGKHPRALLKQGGKRLKSDLPLNLVLIDVGGGFTKDVGRGVYIDPDQINSFPMKMLWQGLSSPQAWNTEPIAVDFKDLMSSLTKTQSAEVAGNTLTDVNLAVIDANYVNLSLRLGYHFTAIDAGVGPLIENNYIFFRFIGGVTDITQRSRRASLLMSILEKNDFRVEISGDLVIARAIHLTREQMKDNLYLIGRLIGFARQLDVLLKHDSDVEIYFEKFMNEIMGSTENQ